MFSKAESDCYDVVYVVVKRFKHKRIMKVIERKILKIVISILTNF